MDRQPDVPVQLLAVLRPLSSVEWQSRVFNAIGAAHRYQKGAIQRYSAAKLAINKLLLTITLRKQGLSDGHRPLAIRSEGRRYESIDCNCRN